MIRIVILVLLLTGNAYSKSDFLSLFEKQKPIIAAIMVEKDLSTPEKVDQALKWSLEQIKIAEAHNMDGILFEFRGGKILSPQMTEEKFKPMREISKKLVKASKKLVVGVEILWHYPEETLRLAKESGAAFVRVDFFSDEVIADKKKVPINPEKILAYKKKIGADDVILLTDIQVKYSKMVDPKIPLDFSAKRAREKGSDGLIVTSTQSGTAPTPQRPKLAKKGAGHLPVVIGSGFSYKNAHGLLEYADAVIVGTSISVKTGGPLVPKKVARLMKTVKEFRNKNYPARWWQPIDKGAKKSWEISPDSVKKPRVIISKRNELGILSNFAETPFELNGKKYGSMEGFWQAMKFPEDKKDPRYKLAKWPYTRAEVEKMTGFKAKRAGDFGSKVMKKNKLDWVTFENKKIKYREKGKGEFFTLIQKGMKSKLATHKPVQKVLCSTGNLELLPDHSQGKNPPAAWKYHRIWMGLRQDWCTQ